MRNYIIRRIIESLLTIFGVLTLTFLVVHMLPGDAVLTIMSFAPTEYVEEMRHALGLDQPLLTQYVNWLVPLITRLDLGRGITINDTVRNMIFDRLPITFELTLLSMVAGLLISVPLGLVAARNRGGWIDFLAMQFSQLSQALPPLWVGTLLFLWLGVKMRVLPSGGWVPLSESVGDNLKHLIMPTVVLALAEAGIITRITRSAMLEVLGKEYVRTAYSKGLTGSAVIWRHVLRNALIPVLTITGVEIGYLLGGTIIIEDIFLLPGIGKLIISALSNRDIPIIQGCLLFYATFFVGLNLLVDLMYSAVDPRISYD